MSSDHPASHQPLQALQAALRPAPRAAAAPRLIVAGATGTLGNEVLRRLAGSGRFAHTEVLAREPMIAGMAQVGLALAPPGEPDGWPARPQAADIAVVMFEPPRLYHDRERALWTPAPPQLPALAAWLRRCGVRALVVVVPHAVGRLPEAPKLGLANLDEQGVAELGFERLLFVRSAQKPGAVAGQGFFRATAAWMLSALDYLIPQAEQPVRPAKLAEFIDAVLRVLPAGTHVVSPELLWQAGQSGAAGGGKDMHSVVQAWLNTRLQS